MQTKSPFYIIEDFISPLMCEELLDVCDFNVPDQDKEGHEVRTEKTCERAEAMLYERLLLALPEIQAHYSFLYKGTERIKFEWFPDGSEGTPHAENSEFLRGKWLRCRQRDITAVLFLSDYQDKTPFEDEFEVLGGKLEFPQHQFGFNPQRGTLVFFPSDPHFINVTSRILVGDLFQARIQIAAQTPYIYNPADFPGNYTTWFNSLLNQ